MNPEADGDKRHLAIRAIHETAERGRAHGPARRRASQLIFEFVDNEEFGSHESNAIVLALLIDINRLSVFELKTILVAVRPVIGRTQRYRCLFADIALRTKDLVGKERARELMAGMEPNRPGKESENG